MDRGAQVTVLGAVAADQWGLVTAAQAKAAGLNGVQLKRLAEAGLVEIVARGVYLLAAAGQPRHLEIKAAWLRLQPAMPAWERPVAGPDSGVVSHASACQLHEVGDIPAPAVEISVPRRRTTTEPFVHLRTAPVAASDVTIVDGLPVTTASRTIEDLLRAKADGGHAGGVIADAERRGLVDLDDLCDRVQPYTRSYGLPRTADGRALIEHLVAQAGESLQAQQLEHAAQRGFDLGSAAVVAALQEATPASAALQDVLLDLARRRPTVNPAVAAALRDSTSALQRALQDVARLQLQLPSANAAVAAAVRNATPAGGYPQLQRVLQDLARLQLSPGDAARSAAARDSMPREVLRGTVVPSSAVAQAVQSAPLTQAVHDAHPTVAEEAPHDGPAQTPRKIQETG